MVKRGDATKQGMGSDANAGGETPLLSLRGIVKSFPGVAANDGVDLDARQGEILALLGENGAGKSTLMKILYGFYRADGGEILLNGRPVRIRSPHDARRLGIGMVFQNFTLIPALSVFENIALFLTDLPMILNRKEIVKRIEEVSERYGLRIDPRVSVRSLSVGEQQKVEIIKLLLAKARILIFDEPTKVLAPHEIEGLMRVFDGLRRDGYAVVFITHKLREVMACADRVAVMRKGKIVGLTAGSEATEDGLVSLMFGAAPSEPKFHRAVVAETAPPLLELKNLDTSGADGAASLKNINLRLLPGEILGVAGVSGNGQKELGDVVLGLLKPTRGRKFLSGRDATAWPVAKIRAGGVAFIPEDPLMAVVPGMTVLENMALGATWDYARRGGLAMDWDDVRDTAGASMKNFGFNALSMHKRAGTLSGGNLQRIILARELARHPRLILAFYPTRGLDVPSANTARVLLAGARDSGAGVILISEDLGELFTLSDRLAVLQNGAIAGCFRPEETSPNEVGHLMTGSGERT